MTETPVQSVGRFALVPPSSDGPPWEVLAWDGRLDNRDDLRFVLSDRAGSALSDGALVGAAYGRWGSAGLGRVIGDWCAVIRDVRRGAIVLASDFAGVRPLYYHQHAGTISWSVRLGALVEATASHALDEDYVRGFLTLNGCPNHTPYAGVLAVPPGDAVEVTSARTTVSRFWTPPVADVIEYADERRYDEQFRSLFRDAVAVRLQTGLPVIAELSGGLDSSSVVCMATDLIQRGAVPAPRLTTVSYVYRGSSDVPFIREVEAFCGIEGTHLSTHDNPLISVAEVGSIIPEGWGPLQRSVAEVARRAGATVLLTGQNGDLVTGNWFDDSLQVAASLRRGRVGLACKEALGWSKVLRVPVAWILSRAIQAALPAAFTPRTLYGTDDLSQRRSPETSLPSAFYSKDGAPDLGHSWDWMQAPPQRRKHFRAFAAMRELRALQALEPLQHLDATHPFSHRPLVEFLLSVPADVLCRSGEPRRLMRRALGDLLPPKLRARRSKSLFGEPWVEALRPLAVALLAAPQWAVVERGWVERSSLTSRLEKLVHGLDCNEPQLRQIILLEYWLRGRGQGGRGGEAHQAA